MAFLTMVGLLAGMSLEGSLLEIAGLYILGLLMTIVASLWAAGFALRARVTQAQSAISMPLFLALMLSPAFVPRALLSDWLESVADYNPYTAILEGSRGLISGNPDGTGLAFLVVACLILVFTAWSLTGLRAALQST
jgi:ABC-type multidrug transport system permease subunit